MEAVIRHDHYPKNLEPRRAPGRRETLRSVAGGSRARAADARSAGWNVSPLQAANAAPRRIDAFRLVTSLFGLTLYLGAPIGLMIWLGTAIFR